MIRLYLEGINKNPYKLVKEVRSKDDKWFVGNINANHIEVIIDDESSEILDVTPILSLITSNNRTIYAIVPYNSDSIVVSDVEDDYFWFHTDDRWTSSKGETQSNLPDGHFVRRYFFSILNHTSNVIREGSTNVQIIVEKDNYRQTCASIIINIKKGVYETPEVFISNENAVHDLNEVQKAQNERINAIDNKQNSVIEDVEKFKNEWTSQRIGLLSVGNYDSSTGTIEFIYDDEKIVDFDYDENSGILTIEY